jgi:hypothetical protein
VGILRRLAKAVPLFGVLDRYIEMKRFRARIRAMPVTRMGDLAEGVRGKIVGRAMELEQTLVAPLSGRTCVYWRIEIEDRGEAGVLRGTLASFDESVAFLLVQPNTGDDNSLHRAVIDARNANVRGDRYHTTKSKAAFDATPAQRALLERENLIHRDWFQTTGLEYRESIISIGAQVTVVGEGVREPDPDAEAPDDYRGSVRTRLRIAGTRDRPIDIDAEDDAT